MFTLANSADPDEVPLYAVFHLGLYCLPKYLFIHTQNEKGDEYNAKSGKVCENNNTAKHRLF